jgi:MerR family transcriptional regulator, heat shock protein HspR
MATDDLYFISMAARELGMHPQTLRKYERLGLVRPTRTIGSVRVYTRDEIDRLRTHQAAGGRRGINLAGVQRLLDIAEAVARLRPLTPMARAGAAGRSAAPGEGTRAAERAARP